MGASRRIRGRTHGRQERRDSEEVAGGSSLLSPSPFSLEDPGIFSAALFRRCASLPLEAFGSAQHLSIVQSPTILCKNSRLYARAAFNPVG